MKLCNNCFGAANNDCAECEKKKRCSADSYKKGDAMRIYISGPISGTNDYTERFAHAAAKIREEFPGAGIVNPAKLDAVLLHCFDYEDYMDVDLLLLDKCDVVYMLKGWEKSHGANREYGYALAKDKIILHEGGRS